MTFSATFRSLRRNPWFTVTAVLTLALGIGAAVSMFSVVNQVLIAPLPYRDPGSLVWISTWNAERGQYSKSSGFDFNVWKARTETFDQVEAFWDRSYTVTGTTRPEGLSGWQFTPGLFALLGTSASVGRTFLAEDAMPGRETVVVLSDELWRRRFDARPDIVGTSLELDGRAHAIVGVMPATFTHPYPNAQLWTPVALAGHGSRRPQAAALPRRRAFTPRRHPRAGRDRVAIHRRAAGAGVPRYPRGLLCRGAPTS